MNVAGRAYLNLPLAASLAVLACAPPADVGPCRDSAQCPQGYHCEGSPGRCVIGAGPVHEDGAVVDAPALDAAAVDRRSGADSAPGDRPPGDAFAPSDRAWSDAVAPLDAEVVDATGGPDVAAGDGAANADGAGAPQDAAGLDAAASDTSTAGPDAAVGGDALAAVDAGGVADSGMPTGPPAPLSFAVTVGDQLLVPHWQSGGGSTQAFLLVRRIGAAVLFAPDPATPYYQGTELGDDQRVVYVGTASSLIDEPLVNGTRYHYRLWAIDPQLGYSPPVQAQGEPIDLLPPPQPQPFVGERGDGRAALSWVSGGGDTAGFLLVRRAGQAVVWAPVRAGSYSQGEDLGDGQTLVYVGAVENHDEQGLVNDTTYHYALFAFDAAGNHADAVTTEVTPTDLTPPPPLASFSASTGAQPGWITLGITFPVDVSDYAQVLVLSTPGGVAPPPSCDSGDVVANITSFASGRIINHTGLPQLAYYSYRVCIYDANGNLTSTNLAENVRAKGCMVSASAAINPTGLMAAVADRWYWDNHNVVSAAWAPVRIFAGARFVAGDRVTLTAASGLSLCRIHNMDPPCTQVCPGGWKLFFRDGNGTILRTAGLPEDLVDFSAGVPVPGGAVDAWIGYRDSACQTGSVCSDDSYFDNEGARSDPTGTSTNGCSFAFRYDEMFCN